MPDLKIDWERIVEDAAEEGKEALKEFLDGAAEDLKTFGKEIAKDMIQAIRDGREDLVAQLKAQGRTLAEAHRIRLNHIAWDQAMNIFERISKIAVKAALSVSII